MEALYGRIQKMDRFPPASGKNHFRFTYTQRNPFQNLPHLQGEPSQYRSRDYLDFCRRDDFLDSRHYFPALERKSIRALTSL